MKHSPSDKAQVIPVTRAQLPGACASCGTGNPPADLLVDFGLWIEFHGVVYLCKTCALGVAAPFGIATKDEYDEIAKAEEIALERIDELTQQVQSLEEDNAGFARCISVLGGDPVPDSNTNDSIVGSKGSKGNSKGSNRKRNTGEAVTDEPPVKPRRNNPEPDESGEDDGPRNTPANAGSDDLADLGF